MAKHNIRRFSFKKLANIIIIALIIFCLLSMAGSAIIFRTLFGRSELTPHNLELSYSDIESSSYPRTAVYFQSGDNMLKGYLYEVENSRGIIVIVHGINGGADSHLAETTYFIDKGWSVFCFDGTGSRESEGEGIVGLSQMKLDLLSALDYLSVNYPRSPLLLYGHSMGAYACASVLDDRPDIAGAVVISGFDSPVDTMYYHAKLRIGAIAALGYPFLCLHNSFLFGEDANEHAHSAINAVNTPVLIIHGSNDSVVPEDISLYAKRQEITNPNVSYILIEDEARNLHSTPWLSDDSAEYQLEMQALSDSLLNEYGSTLPENVLESFLAQLNRDRLCCIDKEFMDTLDSFFLKSLENRN